MRPDTKLFIGAGLMLALALALFVSPFASSSPDGLNKVAIEKGFDDTAEDHALDGSPLAGYAVRGITDERISKALSGLIGVLMTFGVGLLIFGVVARRREKEGQPLGDST